MISIILLFGKVKSNLENKMSGKGYSYWKDQWDKKYKGFSHLRNPEVRAADYILKKYGRSIFTTYGKAIGDAYFGGSRIQAIILPMTKDHKNMDEIMLLLHKAIGNHLIHENGDLHNILKILSSEAGVDITGFKIEKSQAAVFSDQELSLGVCFIALCVPVVGWGYLFFKLYETVMRLSEGKEADVPKLKIP